MSDSAIDRYKHLIAQARHLNGLTDPEHVANWTRVMLDTSTTLKGGDQSTFSEVEAQAMRAALSDYHDAIYANAAKRLLKSASELRARLVQQHEELGALLESLPLEESGS